MDILCRCFLCIHTPFIREIPKKRSNRKEREDNKKKHTKNPFATRKKVWKSKRNRNNKKKPSEKNYQIIRACFLFIQIMPLPLLPIVKKYCIPIVKSIWNHIWSIKLEKPMKTKKPWTFKNWHQKWHSRTIQKRTKNEIRKPYRKHLWNHWNQEHLKYPSSETQWIENHQKQRKP